MVGQSTINFSDYCTSCEADATTALKNAFAAMANGDTFNMDTDSTVTYIVDFTVSPITMSNNGTYNFNGRWFQLKGGTEARYGDWVFSASNTTVNGFYYDQNEANTSNVISSTTYGVLTAVAWTGGVTGLTFNNIKLHNTRQMAMSGGSTGNLTIDGFEFKHIGEHCIYFTTLTGDLLIQNGYVDNFALGPENFNSSRNIEFTKIPSPSTMDTATYTLKNITFNQTLTTADNAVYPMIKSNTVFEGEIWENITFTPISSLIWGYYATNDPSTLTIRDSDFGKNEIFYSTVNNDGAGGTNYSANGFGHEIANIINIENTIGSMNRVSTAINSWSGGTMYLSNSWYGDVRQKRNFTSDVLFSCMDIILDGNEFEYYDFSGNVTFDNVNFTIESGTSGFDMGDDTAGIGTIRVKNSTINVPGVTLFKNTWGGTIDFISEETNTITAGTLTGAGFNSVTTGATSTGGVDCGVLTPTPPIGTTVTGSENYLFLIN